MHNLIRYYYQNKYKIWGCILFIVLVFLSIQIINRILAQNNEQILKNNNISNNIKENTIINNNSYLVNDESAITGENINNNSLKDASTIIENFITACNNGNIEEAYNYLSTDCKQEIYSDINKFKTLYYDVIFAGNKKSAAIENWMKNTYKVDIQSNIMETGNANGIKTQDYMTVVSEGEDIKLNINSFIEKEKIDKEYERDGIKFTIVDVKTYMDYEQYTIQVQNNTGNSILLDSQQSTKTIYLQDENEAEYYADINEIPINMLKIENGFSTSIQIKFAKTYSLERKTSNIIFADVNLNYNIEELREKKEIKIDL